MNKTILFLLIPILSLILSPLVHAETRQHGGFVALSVEDLKHELARQKLHNEVFLLRSLPADFPDIRDANEKKQLFMQVMLPIILAENQRLAEQRALAKLMIPHKGERRLGNQPADLWLKKVLTRYRIKHGGIITPALGKQLLRRLDTVPPRMALAQAAIESGWGTSRFALEGNSLFGQWTWAKGSGLTPSERDDGESHAVKAFHTLRSSVRAYLLNLNANPAYAEFRALRAQLRNQGRPADAHILAAGLRKYSQRGSAYVQEVRDIINSADLQSLAVPNLQVARQ